MFPPQHSLLSISRGENSAALPGPRTPRAELPRHDHGCQADAVVRVEYRRAVDRKDRDCDVMTVIDETTGWPKLLQGAAPAAE
jgi:hypothetical protein